MSIVSRLLSWLRKKPEPAPQPVIEPPHPASAARFWEDVLGHLAASGKVERTKDRGKVRSLKMPDAWPGVLPSGAPKMAADSQLTAVYNFGANVSWDGYGFMGYALLSDLAQVPEFRTPAQIRANDMARKWIKLVSVSEDDKTDKIKALESELKRLGAQEKFRTAFELDNFFGRSQIVLDVGATEKDLATPLVLSANVEKGSLKGIRVVEPIWTYPNQYDSINPLNPAFYRPQTWFVLAQEIHATRMLTFVSRPVPDMLKPAYMFGGLSLTQMLEPYVRNWIRTRQSVSDITHNFSTPVLATDLGQITQPGGAAQLALRAQIFNTGRDNQGLMLINSATEEDFKNVSAPIAGLDKLQAQAQEQMAGIAQIPLVKFFGLQPAGLNASSDGEIRVYYDGIEADQERTGTPNMRHLLDVMQMSMYGEIDSDIGFTWEPLWSLDEEKQANIRKIDAETDGAYVEMGAISNREVRKTIAGEEDSRYASIDVDVMPEPAAEDPAGDPEMAGLLGAAQTDPAAEPVEARAA